MTLYFALQQSIKLELLNAIIYCSILSSIWTLYHSRATDWTFGLKDVFTSLKILFQNKIGGKNYDYYPGKNPVLITVPHATPPGGEVLVEYIGSEIAKQLNAHLIIGRISRTILDLNRIIARSSPFRKKIRELVEKSGIILILDIHGFSSKLWKPDMDVEIGTSNLKTAKSGIRDIMANGLKEDGIDVSVDTYFKGVNKAGNIINSYGNAKTVNALQIEIHRNIRNFESEKFNKVVEGIIKSSFRILRDNYNSLCP